MIFNYDFLENYNSLQKKNKQVIYTALYELTRKVWTDTLSNWWRTN